MNNYRHSLRDSYGRFRPVQSCQNIVRGRLYQFRGIPCRAKQRLSDNRWLVVSHKILEGVVAESDLRLISKKTVKNYLKNA